MNAKLKTSAAAALLLLAGSALAGCQLDDAALEDNYVPQAHYERYPIKVVTAPVSVGVSARLGRLGTGQINAIANFASQARSNSASRIKISYPSATASGRKVAHEIASLVAGQGIAPRHIAVTSYRGAGPIRISYVRKVAVTRECGDWSENLAVTSRNEPSPNFGCALQHNTAAMVSDPQDFETPRAMTPVWGPAAANRTAAILIYMTGDASTTVGGSTSSTGGTTAAAP